MKAGVSATTPYRMPNFLFADHALGMSHPRWPALRQTIVAVRNIWRAPVPPKV
jgi:hypothetical protein